MSQIDTKKELNEQEELQREYGEAVQDMISDSKVHDKEIETCQAYLQETRIEDDWDCETILSTYSTLDNHPTVIKDTNTKYRKYKNHYLKSLEVLEQQQQSSLGLDCTISSNTSNNGCNTSITSGKYQFVKHNTTNTSSLSVLKIANELRNNVSNNKNKSDNMLINTTTAINNTTTNNSNNTTSKSSRPTMIVLSGKLNLPSGYGPSHFENKKNIKPQRSLDSFNNNTTNNNILEVIDEDEEENYDNNDDNNKDDNNDNNNDYSSSDSNKTDDKHINYIIRPKNETSHDKKLRKDKVKEERRLKRLNKKELKTIYKMEGNKIIHNVAKEQNIDHISVFKY